MLLYCQWHVLPSGSRASCVAFLIACHAAAHFHVNWILSSWLFAESQVSFWKAAVRVQSVQQVTVCAPTKIGCMTFSLSILIRLILAKLHDSTDEIWMWIVMQLDNFLCKWGSNIQVLRSSRSLCDCRLLIIPISVSLSASIIYQKKRHETVFSFCCFNLLL